MSNEMITKWEDAGRDCGFCGGEVYKRTDIDSNESLNICFECRECGAQWTFNGSLQREPHGGTVITESTQVATRKTGTTLSEFSMPRWAWFVLAVFAAYLFIRWGGMAIIRFLIPPILLVVVVYIVFRVGQDNGWWR